MEFTTNRELIETLFRNEKVYKRKFKVKIDKGYPHSNLTETIIVQLYKIKVPTFIVEVGSMIGDSAVTMAKSLKKIDAYPDIVCLDPFTGDVNMWAWEKDLIEKNQWRFIKVKNGRSTIRNRFEKNIMQEKLTDQIIPLEMTSLVGLRLLQRLFHEDRRNQNRS